MPRHAMVAREDGDQRPVDGGRAPLPRRDMAGDLLEPAERTPRLRQFGVARDESRHRCLIRLRHLVEQRPDVVEREARGLLHRRRLHRNGPGAFPVAAGEPALARAARGC